MGKLEKLSILSFLFAAVAFVAFSEGSDPDEGVENDPVAAAFQRLRGEDEPGPDTGSNPPSGELAATTDTESNSGPSEKPIYGIPEAPGETPGSPGSMDSDDPEILAKVAAESLAPLGEESHLPNASDLLLDRSTKAGEQGLSTGPKADEKYILQNSRGLRPSKSSAYKEYFVQEGDTWAGLAQRFYRNGRYTRNLRLANEGRENLQGTRSILVPVYDHLVESGTRAPLRPERILTAGMQSASPKPVGPKPIGRNAEGQSAARRAAITAPTTYRVLEGDNLSKISLHFYGTATRWQEIYEANRGLLGSADWLELGMTLTIPVVDLSTPVKASAPKTMRSNAGSDAKSTKKKGKVK